MSYFNTSKGIKLYYESYGTGQPILFIHPPLLGLEIFRYQRALAERFQVILYDMRGHGRSGYLPSEGIDQVFPDHLNDLVELIDHLEIKKPILSGYSNGALIALAFALQFRERVGGLILSAGYPKVDSLLLRLEYLIGIQMMLIHDKKMLSSMLAIAHKVTDEDKLALYAYAVKANTHAVLDLYRTGLTYNSADQLSQLNQLPVLLIYGTWDKFISKHQEIFKKHLDHLTVVYVDKAFHQLPSKHHQEFNQIVEHFLNGLTQ